MTRRKKWLEVAHDWIGVPWASVGTRREGVNCYGLIVGVARECGYWSDEVVATQEALAAYRAPPTRGEMMRRAHDDSDMILVKDARPGDLMIFRVNGQPQHIAIVTNLKPLQIIHSDVYAKAVRKSVIEPGWHPVAAFRIRELEE